MTKVATLQRQWSQMNGMLRDQLASRVQGLVVPNKTEAIKSAKNTQVYQLECLIVNLYKLGTQLPLAAGVWPRASLKVSLILASWPCLQTVCHVDNVVILR